MSTLILQWFPKTYAPLLSILPEFVLVIFACVGLLFTFKKNHTPLKQMYLFFVLPLVISLFLILDLHGFLSSGPSVLYYSNMFQVSYFDLWVKAFLLLTLIFVGIYSATYVQKHRFDACAYSSLALLSVVGMLIMISSRHLLLLYLGIELMSLPLYAMVAMKREDGASIEAALKYFVTGALASCLLLFGMSLLYGATQNLDYTALNHFVMHLSTHAPMSLSIGLVFIFVGLAFKLGLVPFHQWVPDVYAGAPLPVTMLIATAPKISVLSALFVLFNQVFDKLATDWQPLFVFVAVFSIVLGNIAAVIQTNIKRLLAYSSIAHMGYLFLGLIAFNQLGYQAAWFYLVTYTLTSLIMFGGLTILSSNQEQQEWENINDLNGLYHRAPWLAFLFLIATFSLAGVPPLLGFMAKFSVLNPLIQMKMLWLAIIAVLASVVGAYYYLRLIGNMYFKSADQETSVPMPTSWGWADGCLTVNTLAIFVLGFMPYLLFKWLWIAL